MGPAPRGLAMATSLLPGLTLRPASAVSLPVLMVWASRELSKALASSAKGGRAITSLRENMVGPVASGSHLAKPCLNGGLFQGITPFRYQQSLKRVHVLQGMEGEVA